ncbi:MAG: arginase [Chthonomonas sp.]|nr:arginase [Chthonomonas sp.]
MLELLGLPFDKGGRTRGSRLGPAAIRLAGLIPAMAELGHPISDLGDFSVPETDTPAGGWREFDEAFPSYQLAQQKVAQVLARGNTPLVLAGSHDVALGTVSAALRHLQGDLAVLWIDAHADLNTPATSPSGNLHGTPLAALLGLAPGSAPNQKWLDQWQQLVDLAGPHHLESHRVAWLGLRSVDPGESRHMAQLPGCLPLTMQNIDQHGIPKLIEGIRRWVEASGTRNLWVSFDLDSLDPIYAPGTGTTVRGGLTYREGHMIAELLSKMLRDVNLVGLDVVEVNPTLDQFNLTATMATEWICSLFGKRILGGWEPDLTPWLSGQ